MTNNCNFHYVLHLTEHKASKHQWQNSWILSSSTGDYFTLNPLNIDGENLCGSYLLTCLWVKAHVCFCTCTDKTFDHLFTRAELYTLGCGHTVWSLTILCNVFWCSTTFDVYNQLGNSVSIELSESLPQFIDWKIVFQDYFSLLFYNFQASKACTTRALVSEIPNWKYSKNPIILSSL